MLFNNAPKVVIAIVAFLSIFVLGLSLDKCHAADSAADAADSAADAPYVQMSGGYAIVRGNAPIIDLTYTTPASQLKNAFWQGSMTIIGSSTYYGVDAPNNLVVRGLFVDGFGHFDTGLGLSWMMNPTPYNGSNVNFNLQMDYRFTFLPITLTYTHLSNAGMTAHNLGRDLILIGYRFK